MNNHGWSAGVCWSEKKKYGNGTGTVPILKSNTGCKHQIKNIVQIAQK
jgi:hypothetical protein